MFFSWFLDDFSVSQSRTKSQDLGGALKLKGKVFNSGVGGGG